MFKQMMLMMTEVKDAVQGLRTAASEAKATADTAAIKAERAEAAVADLSSSVKHDLKTLKDSSFTKEEARTLIKEEVSRVTESRPATTQPFRSKSVGARVGFAPKKVFVQGFFDYEGTSGALKPTERDALAERLLADVPEELRGRFELENTPTHDG